ncbi:ABC transporter ATP-binding protein [Streptosporangium carneum]|uniref:Multidrug ABC transporter ATP-binding protein n=1 Tax=Streptosporangium carneum TaxID=47481 RepID=A0A9W6HZM0_9ACTN|nr:ABC transporter ATP-binding protein [Streptosporangium carneum]GLK09302.1 multidrug ABC transporter ATP-binding protein [Streptosporangium carneum]
MIRDLPVADRKHVRQAALRLIRRDVPGFTATLLLNGLAAAAALVSPWLLGRIIDTISAGGTIDLLAAIAVGGALLQLILSRYAEKIGTRFSERTQEHIRQELLDRVLALPTATVEHIRTGDLTARGTTDVGVVGRTLRDAAPAVLISSLQALFLVAAVFLVDPLLGACGLLALAGIAAASRWYLRRARAAYLEEGAARSELAEHLAANAAGARTIEALGLQDRRTRAAERGIERSRVAQLRTLFLRGVLWPSVEVSALLPPVLVLLLGGALLDSGQVTLGAVVSSTLYLRQLQQPIETILIWMEQLQSSGASFARIEGLQTPATQTAVAAPEPRDEHIVATGVHFAYESDDVVTGVDLTIRPGERLAIVGSSGAGKSTLGKLLAGIDRPRLGMVTVGSVPVADLSPAQLRKHVVLVTQEQHLFLGTVRDNLHLADPTADDNRLEKALAAVGADWVASLDDELGSHSSGTELGPDRVQQLALARVILADPHTVILDEATAMLDPRTARRAERSLAAVLEGRTVIAIAHRLHTARDADRVVVMEGGRVAEIGAHDELIAAGGVYEALWSSWHGSRRDY